MLKEEANEKKPRPRTLLLKDWNLWDQLMTNALSSNGMDVGRKKVLGCQSQRKKTCPEKYLCSLQPNKSVFFFMLLCCFIQVWSGFIRFFFLLTLSYLLNDDSKIILRAEGVNKDEAIGGFFLSGNPRVATPFFGTKSDSSCKKNGRGRQKTRESFLKQPLSLSSCQGRKHTLAIVKDIG